MAVCVFCLYVLLCLLLLSSFQRLLQFLIGTYHEIVFETEDDSALREYLSFEYLRRVIQYVFWIVTMTVLHLFWYIGWVDFAAGCECAISNHRCARKRKTQRVWHA